MEINEKIKKLTEDSGLDFSIIFDISNVKIRDAKLHSTIYGLASYKEVFIDIDKMIDTIDYELSLFIILHEIAHYKRISKMGLNKYLDNITNEDIIVFLDFIIQEEIFADRWASLVFYLKTGKEFPRNKTQRLDDKYNREKYERRLGPSHEIYRGKNLYDYEEILKNYVIDVR